MSDKGDVKRAIYHELGVAADDWREAALAQRQAHGGAKMALRELAAHLGAVAQRVDQDQTEGKLAALEGPLQMAAYAKLQIQRCIEAALASSRHQENLEIAATGAAAAHEHSVGHLRKLVDRETAKAQAIAEGEASGELVPDAAGELEGAMARTRPAGVRPAASLAAQRKAEEKRPPGRPRKVKGPGNGAHP